MSALPKDEPLSRLRDIQAAIPLLSPEEAAACLGPLLLRLVSPAPPEVGNGLPPAVVDEKTAAGVLHIEVGEMQENASFYSYARAQTHGKRRKYWQHLLGIARRNRRGLTSR